MMFLKQCFPHGLRSLAGFLMILTVMLVAEPLMGALNVQAETVTQEQLAALHAQEEAARQARERQEQAQALEALRGSFRNAGTTLDLSTIPEETLGLAQRIDAATPLDPRSALAAAVYARKFNLRPSLLLAVISKESNFHQFSVGSHRDRGFLQIIPPTERFMARNYGPALGLSYDPGRIFDPEYNLGLGAAYLGGMMAEYGSEERALTEYNRGEGRTESYFERNNSYSTSYSRKVKELERQYLSLN